jgi:beta-alanine degradation protein BauB
MNRVGDFGLGLAAGLVVAAAAVAASSATLDPVELSPQMYKVRLENEHVRVLEFHSNPGDKEPLHSHRHGVLIALADSTVKTTLADGTSSARPVHAGEITWRDALSHSLENVGATEAHYYSIELMDSTR